MKKNFCLVLSFLFIFNLFGQEIFTSRVNTETSIYYNGDVKMVLLDKYKVIKDYCVKSYYPTLENETILIGEDLINFLDKSNNELGRNVHASIFYKSNGLKYIVFNGDYFFDRYNMIRLTCHELAHFSSGSYDHDTDAYQKEVKRLKTFGIDINTHKDSSLMCDCVKDLSYY